MKRSVEDFLSSFVQPLVAGGAMHVQGPISEPELRVFTERLPHASVEATAVDDARARVLAELVVRPPPQILDDEELALAAAVHNLLFLVHPDAESLVSTRGMERRVLDTARLFARQPLTVDRRRVLSRHGLLHNVFRIARSDVTVKWWTGRARFFGQEPPARLTRWKSLRRVSREVSDADFAQLFGGELVAPVMIELLRRSPLTVLLHPLRMGAVVRWEDLVFVLRDGELARAVSYRALEGPDPESMVAAPAAYAAAFEQMLERKPAEADVRTVAAFLVHLCGLIAVAEASARDRRRSALLNVVLAPERVAARPRGLTTWLALPAALAEVDGRLAEPPGLDRDPQLRQRWQQHREQVLAAVGPAAVESLATRLSRHMESARAA